MIRTERLVLRPFLNDDLADLHAIFSHPRAMRYWDRPAWSDIAETQALLDGFMRHAPDEHLEYAVLRDGKLIGRVGMWRRHEIGFILHPEVWGNGFAREALSVLVAEVFARFPQARELTAEVDPRNRWSAGLLEALGFRRTAIIEKNFDYGGIELCDTAYYALSRPSSQSCQNHSSSSQGRAIR